MKNIIHTLLSITLLTGLAGNTYAAKKIEIAGQGIGGCGEWIAEKKSSRSMDAFNKVWILGYLSGRAASSNVDILRGTPNESLFLWIDNHCNQYPLETIEGAGQMLFYELKKQKELE